MNNESRPTLTSNKPQTPKGVKIRYCLERVEQYVPALLRCFKCQKFGHHREASRGRQTCSKCGEKDPDHAEEDCLKEITCANCQQDHPAYARTCIVYQKEEEITQEECFLPGSLENCRELYGRKQLRLRCTEGG